MVALEGGKLGPTFSRHLFETLIDVGQGKRAVDLGLACSEQVEIGAVQNQNALRHYGNFVKTDRLFTLKRPVCPLSALVSRRLELCQIAVEIGGVDLSEDLPKLGGISAEYDCIGKAALAIAQLLHNVDAAMPRHQKRIRDLDFLKEAINVSAGIDGYAHEIHVAIFL